MDTEKLMCEIREANLGYMLLAQQMIKQDRTAAIFRLGVSGDVADILESLTPGQILKLATSNMLLCRFRLDDRMIMSMVTEYGNNRLMAPSHAAVMMAGQPAAGLA
jgi:flagellar transcriptional activator FlhD